MDKKTCELIKQRVPVGHHITMYDVTYPVNLFTYGGLCLTNKIPSMDVYGDINLVGHKSKQAEGCLGDLDNASLSKWRHEKKVYF